MTRLKLNSTLRKVTPSANPRTINAAESAVVDQNERDENAGRNDCGSQKGPIGRAFCLARNGRG